MGKHYLIILVGMSPAVVTETVFALCQNNDAPDEVIAITTEKGKNEIKTQLIDSGIWKQMLVDLNLSGKIKFGLNSQNIRIIPDHCREKDSCDIVTTDDNNEMADFLLNELRKYSENPEIGKISFSIAGGRKSMSAVGALVMTLLGRRNDHLYHILVQQPYDNPQLEPRFYYPQEDVYHKFGNSKYAGSDAVLQLGEIPFVRCRYWFEDKKADIVNYSTLVSSINQERIKLRIEIDKRQLYINNKPVTLSYLDFMLYWMFAERKINGQVNLYKEAKTSKQKSLEDTFRDFLQAKKIPLHPGVLGKGNISEKFIYESQLNDLGKKISNLKSKIKKMLQDLSDDDIEAVSLTSFERRGEYGFSRSLINKDDIEIE